MATDAVNDLNELITLCLDGKHGYQQASKNAEGPVLKSFCSEHAAERGRFAADLQTAVRGLGGTPTDDGSVTAAFHRGWIGLKDALTGGDTPIVNECVRGEEHAVKKYQSILADDDVPAELKATLSQQHSQIEQSLTKLKAMAS